MKLNFSEGKVTLVLVRQDLRCGYKRLSIVAQAYLGIDLSLGKDWVVFISKRGHIAKIIHHDLKGSILVTRKLDTGCFQKLLCKIQGAAAKSLSKDELEKYLDGEQIEVKRTNLLHG